MDLIVNHNIAISDTGFLFNPSTGESFTLNPIGVLVINCLKESKDDSEIITSITAEYEVDEKDAERDLLDFKEVLRHFSIIITRPENFGSHG